MIRLLIAGWFEPPPGKNGLHGSTLIQQILSIIAERGGVTAAELWSDLIASDGPFAGLSRGVRRVVRHLGSMRILVQESSGLLLLGEWGKNWLTVHILCSFCDGRRVPLSLRGKNTGYASSQPSPVASTGGDFLGRRWRVIDVDTEKQLIIVVPDKRRSSTDVRGSHTMVLTEFARKCVRYWLNQRLFQRPRSSATPSGGA